MKIEVQDKPKSKMYQPVGTLVHMINANHEHVYGIVVDTSGKGGKYPDEPYGVLWFFENPSVTYYPHGYLEAYDGKVILSND